MIFAFVGPKGCGKSYTAKVLQELLPNSHIRSFAAPIKLEVDEFLANCGINLGDIISKEDIRPIYQVYADLNKKVFGEDIFIRLLHFASYEDESHCIIDDLRFQNEAEYVLKHGGILIRIGADLSKLDINASQHISETEQWGISCTFYIPHKENEDQLKASLLNIIKQINF